MKPAFWNTLSQRFPQQRHVSLRALLVVPFVLEIFLAVGLTGWISFNNGQKAVNDLATQLRAEVTSRIEERVREYLAVPHLVNRLNANAIELNELRLHNPSERLKHFWMQLHAFNLVSHNYMATPDGLYFGARRLHNGDLQVMARNPATGTNEYFATNRDGERTRLMDTATAFDARTRPWYQAGVAAGSPVWSDLYTDFTTKGLAITAVHPMYDDMGELRGVLGSSFLFTWVNDFLSQLKIGQTGETFIMERSGLLVAASTGDPVLVGDPENPATLARVSAKDSPNPRTRETTLHLLRQFTSLQHIDEVQQLDFSIGDERQFLQVTPLTDAWGLDWLIVVVVPESDFMQRIHAIARTTLLFCILALALGLVGGVFTSRLVIRPIRDLSDAARSLSEGNWDKLVQVKREDELGQLGRSFNRMAEELRASFEALENKNAELQKLDQLKDEFLANTSHELRTPLNGIIGLAESLSDGAVGPVSEPQRKNLLMIAQSGHRLTNLVNDILDFSKLKHKTIELQLKPVGVREITEVVMTLNQTLVKQKNLKMINSVPNNLPPALADENRLQQIMHNLIGNAIKFTEHGKIEVIAELLEKIDPSGETQSLLRVTVADTGIGIPADKLERIFLSFEQVDGSTARQYGGTGLGLAVTRQLLELHQGEIGVQSVLGQGSQFCFTLPVAKGRTAVPLRYKPNFRPLNTLELERDGADAGQLPVAETKPNQDSGQFKVLVVDDEPVNLQVLSNHLAMGNYAVTEAVNGIEALELVAEGYKPHLVLLDVMMPKMTGYEVCRRLRERYPPNELPILMLTAKNQVENLVEGLEAGANDYLTKPVSKHELLARIRTHIHLCNINIAYGRFVPHQFILLLDKQSVVDVALGDHVEREMSVLFSDIRGFTTLSETMNPQENFDFINAYLSRMEPIISKHDGFIDKYIGDAIMALFPGVADQALQASIGMLQRLSEYNVTRGRPGRPVLRIGIGLHTGKLMLGTVGGQDRMDGTVIADAVNLASRTEGLTKTYGVDLLITEATLSKLEDPTRYKIRVVDRVKVKGKTKEVTVYEVFDADPVAEARYKQETLESFERGVHLYHGGEIEQSHALFSQVLAINPHDQVAKVYLKRCQKPKLDPFTEDGESPPQDLGPGL